MMKRKEFTILLLIFCSVIVTQLHMLRNDFPINEIDLFIFIDLKQDVQWYVKNMSDYVSSLFLYIALLKLLHYKYKILGWLLIVSIILDIINYWLFYHQFDWVYKSLIIILSTISILNYEKRNNNRSGS